VGHGAEERVPQLLGARAQLRLLGLLGEERPLHRARDLLGERIEHVAPARSGSGFVRCGVERQHAQGARGGPKRQVEDLGSLQRCAVPRDQGAVVEGSARRLLLLLVQPGARDSRRRHQAAALLREENGDPSAERAFHVAGGAGRDGVQAAGVGQFVAQGMERGRP
jgi:hypothetical protein